jgi:uncharacterized membrane protein
MHDWNGVEHMGGMWFWWMTATVIVVALIWAVFRALSQPAVGGDASAEELLKRRYVNGEIDKDIFEKRLQDLRQ